MKHMDYKDTMKMVFEASFTVLGGGCKTHYAEIIQATTQIYIKQMELEYNKIKEKE